MKARDCMALQNRQEQQVSAAVLILGSVAGQGASCHDGSHSDWAAGQAHTRWKLETEACKAPKFNPMQLASSGQPWPGCRTASKLHTGKLQRLARAG